MGTSVELKDYWLTIRRRWKIVVATLLIVVGTAALVTWQTTPQYESSAQLFVSTAPTNTGELVQSGTFATQRVTSYADLVNTRKLAAQVATDLGGEFEADNLRSNVRAEVVPETVSLNIIATNPDEFAARDIAQSYAEALSELVATLETPRGKTNPLATASVVDNAEVSSSPVSPNPVRNLGLGLVLGLLLGVGLAVVRDLLDTSISSPEDVAEVATAPILGHINVDSEAVKQRPSKTLSGATPWAESFRVLRTNMQYVEVDHDARVFVISSSLPGEGKSTCAVNLGVTLAQAGQRVALVECDLRRPTMAKKLNLDTSVGTTSVLIGKVPLEDALQELPGTELQVLSSGPLPPNPSELLQSHAMGEMIADLRARFDIVIIDAPPLLPVTDAALLAAQADGMLAVVRHGKTTRDQLMHALERLDAVDAKCVGVVINMVPVKKASAGYGYGYGYGYTYEPISEKNVTAGHRTAKRPKSRRSAGKSRGSGVVEAETPVSS